MSDTSQTPCVLFTELNESAIEKSTVSEVDTGGNQPLDNPSEDPSTPLNFTIISAENITDSHDADTEMYEITIETSNPDTESTNSNSSKSKSPPKVTNADDANFKEPQMISACKGKGKRKLNTLQSENLNVSNLLSKTPQQNNMDTDYLDNDLQLSSNIETGSLNMESNPNVEPSTSQNQIKPAMTNKEQSYSEPQPLSSSCTDDPNSESTSKRVNLYGSDDGPQMYQAKGNLVTRPIITKNLPELFKYLPVYGKPGPDTTLQEFSRNKIREFIGCDLNDDEFEVLENYCSPELLKTGKELKMQTTVPVMGVLDSNIMHNNYFSPDINKDPPNLVTLKKNKLRIERDSKGIYIKKLKYRGVRVISTSQLEASAEEPSEDDVELEPGVDIIYKVRIYRPFIYSMAKDRFTRTRHSVFCCELAVAGRQRLTELRDRIVCHNDFDLRVDVSGNPNVASSANAKEVFPSGFLFINNVFYVDTRLGCVDNSAPIREWAAKRKLGNFPRRNMGDVRFDQLVLKLGYPEVYVHQGDCEHLFLFSDVRVHSASDPLRLSLYPYSSAIGQNQTVYCTTCAEFSAKWIVTSSDRVPFDPGFFCDTCFKLYMYNDGQKTDNFKAFRYRGNALNILKPMS